MVKDRVGAMTTKMLTPEHTQAYHRLMEMALHQFPADFEASDVHELRQLEGTVFGAFTDRDELVGAVGLRQEQLPKTRHKGVIWGMVVSPAYQGCGVGKKLLAAALAHARGVIGLEQLSLVVGEQNTRARRLYESLGFKAFGLEPRELKVAGRYYNGVHMWIELT
jgi:ribosomal protein S18 acetylase RimI-like enzyme